MFVGGIMDSNFPPCAYQALRLCTEVYGGYAKVEDYVPGQYMKLAYWWPVGSTQLLPAFLLSQNIGMGSIVLLITSS